MSVTSNFPEVDTFPLCEEENLVGECPREQLRKNIAQDNANFYTYAKDYLSLAFPRVNEYEIA